LNTSPADNDKVQALLNDFVEDDPLLEMYRDIYRTMIATSDQEMLFTTSKIPLPSAGPADSALPKDSPKAGSNSSTTAQQRATIIQQIRQGMTDRLSELKARALQEARDLRQTEVAAQQTVVDRKDRFRMEKAKVLRDLQAKDTAADKEITQVRQLDGQVPALDKRIEAHLRLLREKAAELLPPAEPVLASPATVAEKASDLRWFFIIGSPFLAALLALGIGSLVEHYDSRLTHAGDIIRRVGIPVLASLPSSDDAQTDDLWLPQEVSMVDYVNDQYRNIRTALLFGHAKPPRTIVLTAPTAAETKTTLSVNLAISMARAGRSVLLLDADLDSPALADVFDVPESPGWSDVLRNPASLTQALCRTRIERLSVMPAGSHLEHSAELLSSPSCRVLIDSLAQRFEHIIIDAPPLLDCPEGRIIAALADGVICSFSARSTRSGQARRATAILEELGASVIGSVLNT
jgi:capsular exopolysaccharide synthesis family protein